MDFSTTMIIKLHDDFQSLQGEVWNDYTLAISNLIDAHRCGRHIFLPSRTMIEKMRESELFGKVHDAVLSYIRRKYIDYSAASTQCPLIFVAYDHRIGQKPAENRNEHHIDIKLFEDERMLQPFRCVVEHSVNDFTVLEDAFKAVLQTLNGIPRPINIHPLHGGGADIATVLRVNSAIPGPMGCIVDTDKGSPYDQLGGTAKAALAAARELDLISSPFFRFAEIPAREVENLIPIEIVGELTVSPAVEAIKARLLANWPNISVPEKCLYAYYDTKQDIDIEEKKLGSRNDKHAAHLDLLSRRLGRQVAPAISRSLAQEYAKAVMPGDREASRLRQRFVEKFKQSPFFDDVKSLFMEILPLAVHGERCFV